MKLVGLGVEDPDGRLPPVDNSKSQFRHLFKDLLIVTLDILEGFVNVAVYGQFLLLLRQLGIRESGLSVLLGKQMALPQADFDLVEKILDVERFSDVVDSSPLHGRHAGIDLRLARDQDDRRVGADFMQPVEKLHPVHVGHHDVRDNQVMRPHSELVEGFPSIHRLLDTGVTGLEKGVDDHPAGEFVVVNHQDSSVEETAFESSRSIHGRPILTAGSVCRPGRPSASRRFSRRPLL
jgi:hypothetical protein